MNYTNESNTEESKIINTPFLEYSEKHKPTEEKKLSDENMSREELWDKLEQEREEMYAEILKNPKKRLTELYDVSDRERLKIGEFKPIYDPGFGKMRPCGYVKKFYGKNIFRRLKKEQKESLNPNSTRQENHVSTKLYREIITIYENKTSKNKSKKNNSKKTKLKAINNVKPKIKKQNLQRQRKPGDEYFLQTRRGLIKNENYRELFKGPSIVYEWLWVNIARHGWKDTEGYPIKEKYFNNGFLAYSASISEVGKQCGMSKSTVAKYIKQFEQAGIIEVEYLKPKGKKRGQSVFILGKWEKNMDGKPIEIFYREQVFLSK